MRQINVLLVDDDADLGKMMKMRLSREAPEFSFKYVDSGYECLEHIKDNPVDCILSDYQMPEMDGMQLLQEIKGRGVDVPFIFLTGQGNEQVARDAFKNGANDYFTKDIGFAHFTRIINSVEQAVRQRQAHESRFKAETALLDEKNKLADILASVGDGISIQDREFRVLYQNKAHIDMVGSHVGEFCYSGFEKRDIVCEGCPVAMTFEDGGVHDAQRVLDMEGGPAYFDITASPLRDSAGNIVGGIEAVRDVTERIKLAEASRLGEDRLAKSNRDLKMLSECNQALVRSKDERTLLEEVCRNIVVFGGYPTASVHLSTPDAPGTVRMVAHAGQGEASPDVVVPICSGSDAVMDPISRVFCTGEMFLANDIGAQDALGPLCEGGPGGGYASFIGMPLFIDSRPEGVLCIYGPCAMSFDDDEVRLLLELAADLSFGIQALRVRDEKDKTVEALKASRIYLETIIDNEPECVKLIRADGTLQMMNRAGLDMIQAESFEQVKDQSVMGLIAPEFREAFAAVGAKVFSGEPATLEFDMIGFKGVRLRLATKAVPLRDANGDIIALLGVTRDVSEQRRVEQELVRSNNMLSTILDSVNFGMMVVGCDHVIRMLNDTALKMMGYRSESELVGKTCDKVVCIAEGGRCPILDEGKGFDLSERVLLTADGGRRNVLKSVSSVRLDDEEVLLETFVDIPDSLLSLRKCA